MTEHDDAPGPKDETLADHVSREHGFSGSEPFAVMGEAMIHADSCTTCWDAVAAEAEAAQEIDSAFP